MYFCSRESVPFSGFQLVSTDTQLLAYVHFLISAGFQLVLQARLAIFYQYISYI